MPKIQVITPSAINLLTAVQEQVVADRRQGRSTRLVLPSLRRRASLVVNESGALPLTIGLRNE